MTIQVQDGSDDEWRAATTAVTNNIVFSVKELSNTSSESVTMNIITETPASVEITDVSLSFTYTTGA